MGQPSLSMPFGSSKKQPKRKLPKGGKLQALSQSQSLPQPLPQVQSSSQPLPQTQVQPQPQAPSQLQAPSQPQAPSSSSSSTMRSPQQPANNRNKKGKVASSTLAVASNSELGTTSNGTGTGTATVYVPDEDFEGHPDIAHGVTAARNVTIRRRTMEGEDAKKGMNQTNNTNNNESMRAAMELLMDPENDLPFDQVTTFLSFPTIYYLS